MAEERNTIRAVDWNELFPWLKLIKCPAFAMSGGMLVLAALGLLTMTAGWRVVGAMFSSSENVHLQAAIEQQATWPWEAIQPIDARKYLSPKVLEQNLAKFTELANKRGPLDHSLLNFIDHFTGPFKSLFNSEVTGLHFFYSLLCGSWALLVWSIFGGAMTRCAALFLTREETISPREGLVYAVEHWLSYLGGPALPIGGCLLLAIPLGVLGLIANADFGAAVVAIIGPVVIVLSVLMALLLVGLAFGWPLMWPTISVEGTEPFDAMSRSYSYTYHRPFRYLFYVVVALALGTLAILFVELFTQTIVSAGEWGLSWGAGAERIKELRSPNVGDDKSWLFQFAHWLINIWHNLIWLVASGYVASYFWTAVTAIYLLLRRDEDGAELEEIFIVGEDQQYGLPELQRDSAGVPIIGDHKPGDSTN